MSIQNVVIASDLVQDFANKFNNNNQQFVITGSTVGNDLVLTTNGAGNITIPNVLGTGQTTLVQSGLNTYTGGTPSRPTINVSFSGVTNYWKTGSTATSLQPNRSDSNVNSQANSTIAGGVNNSISAQPLCFIGGGSYNSITGINSSILGGINNFVSGPASSVVGGNQNSGSSYYSFVCGGKQNNAGGYYSFIGGGYGNRILGGVNSNFSSILCGNSNTINNAVGTSILAGSNITATASNAAYVPSLYIDQGGINFSSAHTANQNFGSKVLTAGTAVVSSTQVKSNSLIFLTANEGTMTGILQVTARSVGSSFTITSTILTDTEKVSWLIINPY